MRKRAKAMIIRLKIRAIAEKRGLDMAKLSRKSDVAYNTIRSIWTDERRDISLSVLERIAHALNVPVTDLYEVVPEDE